MFQKKNVHLSCPALFFFDQFIIWKSLVKKKNL